MPNRLAPAQIRAARGALDWSMLDLAGAASVSISTVKRMEMSGSQPVSSDIHAVVREAFERAGVQFLDDGKGGWGLLLKR